MTIAVDSVVLCNTCGKSIRECACERQPFTEGDPLVALYSGTLELGGASLTCHVLNNGVRVFDADDLEQFFGGLLQDA